MTEQNEIQESGLGTEAKESIDWVRIVSVLWSSRKLVLYVVGGATLLSIIISLLLPEYYKSTATILPETEKSKLASLGSLSDLAAIAGVSVAGEGSLAKLYPTIMRSEAVLKDVIFNKYKAESSVDSLNLVEYWGMKDNKPGSAYFDALKRLRKEIDISMDIKTNVISLSIETTDKKLSADILNNVLIDLDKFIRTKKTTSASEQRKFVESRLVEVKQDLDQSENNLKDFREKNVQVRSPRLLLEEARLLREVQINSTLFVELKKQYEIVKIEEVKNLPIINILDKATPAVYKESPKRSIIVISTLLLTSVFVVAFFVARHQYRAEMEALISRLRNSLSHSV